MEQDSLPVVIGGRVFQIEANIFLETFKNTLLANVKKAKIIYSKLTPIAGEYLFALDALGITQTEVIENDLLESGGKL